GLSLVEAQASGRPVVASRSGGIADAVRDGETGILVPPDDPAAAANAVRRVLADPALAERMGQAGRRLVERELNWSGVVRELERAAACAGESSRSKAASSAPGAR